MTTERSQHIKVISKLLTITQQVYPEGAPERFAAAYDAGFGAMQKIAAGKSVSEKRLSEIREWMCEASKDCDALFEAIQSTDPREFN